MAKIPIAVQLYSVRKDFQGDPAGTIAVVAKMGYQGVEFAGATPTGRRKSCGGCWTGPRTKCCGTHIGIATLLGDELQKTVEFNQTLGNKFLIVPGPPGDYTNSRQAWRTTADVSTNIVDKLTPLGMKTGYHNHHTEFVPLDGETPWDTFFGNTKREVVMQFDVGNAVYGGGDAVTYLRRYPHRADTVHVKEYCKANEAALIGEGDVNWTEVFGACEEVGDTQWVHRGVRARVPAGDGEHRQVPAEPAGDGEVTAPSAPGE